MSERYHRNQEIHEAQPEQKGLPVSFATSHSGRVSILGGETMKMTQEEKDREDREVEEEDAYEWKHNEEHPRAKKERLIRLRESFRTGGFRGGKK